MRSGRFRCRAGLGPTEWHSEKPKEFPAFLIGLRARDDRNIKSHRLLHVFDRDLWENGKIGDAQAVIPLPVELGGNAAEIADGGESNGQKTIEEFPHRRPTQCDATSRNLIRLKLEIRDRLLRAVKNWLLSSNRCEVAGDVGDLILIGIGIDAAVKIDLNNLWHLMFVLVAAILDEFRNDLLGVEFLESGNRAHLTLPAMTDREAIECGCYLEKDQ